MTDQDFIKIKKYSNRRLYNTEISEYITLEDLFKMISEGKEFRVFDSKTEEDITHNILTQIILEQESKGYKLLPETFLKQIIKAYGSNEFNNLLPTFLEESMKYFEQNHSKLSEFYESIGVINKSNNIDGSKDSINFFEEVTKTNMEIFEKSLNLFYPNLKKDNDGEKESNK